MGRTYISSEMDLEPYIPQSLSEIYDLPGSLWLSAPTFVDTSGAFPDDNIDSRFRALTESFGVVRSKVGEDRYARLVDLAARAKLLFAADPGDENGKSDEGRGLLSEIEEIIQSVRAKRAAGGRSEEESN